MVPIHFVSGYLGSGKTSLLNSLLPQIAGRKVGLILNDFGDIGIDSSLLEGDGGLEPFMLFGGQLFCPCQSGNFIRDIGLICAEDPDLVLVEPSGLVKPAALLRMMENLRSSAPNSVFGSYTCVVDPLTFPVMARTVNAIAEQASVANRFVVNKTDLASREALDSLRELLASINPGAEVVETTQGRVSWEWFSKVYPPVDLGEERIRSFATWGAIGRPKPFVVVPRPSITVSELRSFLTMAAPDTLREKGYVDTADGGLVYAQIVSGRVSIEPWSKPCPRKGLSFIQLASHQAEYEEALG